MAAPEEPIPSVKDLASSDPRLRRLALDTITADLTSRTRPLSPTQALQLWRGFYVALYMHDSKSAISVQNLISTLAGLFDVVHARDGDGVIDGDGSESGSQLTTFTEAFWETIAREWGGIDVHRMNKILLLVRFVTRKMFVICFPEGGEGTTGKVVGQQLAIFEKWPLNPRMRNVPDGLRYHVLDIWVDELELVGKERGDEVDARQMMGPVERLAKDGATKPVRTRAKDILAEGRERLGVGVEGGS